MPYYRIETPLGDASVVTKRLKSGRWAAYTRGQFKVEDTEVVAFARVFVARLVRLPLVAQLWDSYKQ